MEGDGEVKNPLFKSLRANFNRGEKKIHPSIEESNNFNLKKTIQKEQKSIEKNPLMIFVFSKI